MTSALLNGLRAGLIFLCHSSDDKPFVEQVLEHIPKSHVFYDTHALDPGASTLDSIEAAVLSADVFVLFLSKESANRDWVKFEIGLAKAQKIKQTNLQVIVVPIGGATTLDAPTWMQSYFCVQPQYTIQDISRSIRTALVEVLQTSGILRPPLFEGRESFCNSVVVECLTRANRIGSPVNFLVFAGINQMGRTTAATNLISRIYPASRKGGPILDLAPFADALDLFLALRGQIDRKLDNDSIRTTIAKFNALSPLEQSKTIFANLRHFGAINQIVTVRSAFGLRERTTRPKEWVLHLMDLMRHDDVAKMIWISERLLPPEQLTDQLNVAQFTVPELDEQSIFIILNTLLGAGAANAKALQNLARQVTGHIGTVYHVVSLIESGQRTPETINDVILSFQETIVRTLMEELVQNDEHRNILLLLSLFPHCDYEILLESLGLPIALLNGSLQFLSDCCVVTFSLNRGYKIPELIRSAIQRLQVPLESRVLERAKEHLRRSLHGDSLTIEQVDALLFMYATFEDRIPVELRDLLLPSVLQEIISAHRAAAFATTRDGARQSFELAAKLSLLALEIPMADETREQILYDGADAMVRCGGDPMPIVEYMRAKHMTSAHLVLGSYYLYRKRDMHGAEIELTIAFKSNERRSRAARLLARALRGQGRGRAKEALEIITSFGEQRINRDSLLLREKIQCLRSLGHDEDVAEALERLEALDDVFGDFHAFRAAELLNNGRPTEAARHIRLALDKPRSNKVQLSLLDAQIQIELGNTAKANEICAFVNSLGMYDDARQIRARLALKQGSWQDATDALSGITKKTYYDLFLIGKMLELKLNDFDVQANPVLFEATEDELTSVQKLIESGELTLERT